MSSAGLHRHGIKCHVQTGRSELVASQKNPLTRLLPAQDATPLSSDVLAAHHSGVTWYLSRRLAEASQTQKEMQEERVKRQLERTRTGSDATREVLQMGETTGYSRRQLAERRIIESPCGDPRLLFSGRQL